MNVNLSTKELVATKAVLCEKCTALAAEKNKLKAVSPKSSIEIKRLNKIDYDMTKYNSCINKLEKAIHGDEIARGVCKPLLG